MTEYKTYRDEYTEQDLDEHELVKTDPRIKRPACPLCQSDTYVTPMQYGLLDPTDITEHEIGIDEEEFVTVTYSCVVEPYEWDCARCFIRF